VAGIFYFKGKVKKVVRVAKLTDKAKKEIIAKKAEGLTNCRLASMYHVSETTIRRVLQNDPCTAKMVEEKKKENTETVLAYMEGRTNIVCEIIGNGLEVLADKEKMRSASLAQITTALGTLIDKWTGNLSLRTAGQEVIDDPLSASLKALAAKLEGKEDGGAE
jgi:hypothetical protein